jgi:hypothetical protein
MAIVSALEYNTFFRGLKVSHTRLSNDTLERILHVMKRSMWLEELHLEGLGLKADFIHKLAVSVISNNNPALKTIDLNHNLLEDKGESSNLWSNFPTEFAQGVILRNNFFVFFHLVLPCGGTQAPHHSVP